MKTLKSIFKNGVWCRGEAPTQELFPPMRGIKGVDIKIGKRNFFHTAIFLINIYQKISKYFPKVCRFYPTCSEYTKQAILKYGFLKGGWIGIKRICRCHPFNQGGHDPVL